MTILRISPETEGSFSLRLTDIISENRRKSEGKNRENAIHAYRFI